MVGLPQQEHLAGERVLLAQNANLRVSPGEALGGRLQLTTHRLVFSAHPVNRIVGRLSLFLPTIAGLQDTSRFVAKRLAVETAGTGATEFVVWGIPKLIAAITAARKALPPAAAASILAELVARPDLLGPDVRFEPLAALLRQSGFDPRERAMPWPEHPLGSATAVNAVSLALID